MTVTFMQVFISSLLGGVLGILFLIPFRKYFVSDMHGGTEMFDTGTVVAGNEYIRKELIEVIARPVPKN